MSELYKNIYNVDNTIDSENDERFYWYKRLQVLLGELRAIFKMVDVIENGKLKKKEIRLSVAWIKAIEEVINNSVDIYIKTSGKYANKLKVTIKGNRIIISDNGSGTGIPIDKVEAAFTNFRTSSNFEWKKEDGFERVSGSQNGIGAKATNVGSTFFEVVNITLDGKRGVLTCRDNMKSVDFKVDEAPKSSKPGVTVSFELDENIFGVTEDMMPDIINHIHALLLNINVTYPGIDITYQDQLIKIKHFTDYMKYISDTSLILHDDEKISVAVYPSDDFNFIFSANSINLYQGGNVLTYVSNSIINKFTERLQKGYKGISTTHVKNKLGFVVILRNVTNLTFGGGQNKSSLTNTYTELGLPTLNYTAFADNLFKYGPIKDPIMDLFKIMQKFEEQKALKDAFKPKKPTEVEKLLTATEENIFLHVVEGDSAKGLANALGRKNKAYITSGGKLPNLLDAKSSEIAKNKKIKPIIESLGYDFSKKPEEQQLNYEYIVSTTDADPDGMHIQALLLTFIYNCIPQLLEQGKVLEFQTPMFTLRDKQNNIIDFAWDFQDKKEKDLENKPGKLIYHKGLAEWDDKSLTRLIELVGDESELYVQLEVDEDFKSRINSWMGKDLEYKKSYLSDEVQFDINGI